MLRAIKKAISLSFICEIRRKGHGTYILAQKKKYRGGLKGVRRKYELHKFETMLHLAYRKRQGEMIQTGVLELVERPGRMPADGTHKMQDMHLIHIKNTALRHRKRQIACYC